MNKITIGVIAVFIIVVAGITKFRSASSDYLPSLLSQTASTIGAPASANPVSRIMEQYRQAMLQNAPSVDASRPALSPMVAMPAAYTNPARSKSSLMGSQSRGTTPGLTCETIPTTGNGPYSASYACETAYVIYNNGIPTFIPTRYLNCAWIGGVNGSAGRCITYSGITQPPSCDSYNDYFQGVLITDTQIQACQSAGCQTISRDECVRDYPATIDGPAGTAICSTGRHDLDIVNCSKIKYTAPACRVITEGPLCYRGDPNCSQTRKCKNVVLSENSCVGLSTVPPNPFLPSQCDAVPRLEFICKFSAGYSKKCVNSINTRT